jgi:hypothetical protein
MPQASADGGRTKLRDLLLQSFERGERDLGRLALFMRLLAQTGQIDTLVNLATLEMFHEVGDPSELRAVLETAAESPDLSSNDRFWALDALAFWDSQSGLWDSYLERVRKMAEVVRSGASGETEQISLRMKQMVAGGKARDIGRIEAAFRAGEDLARRAASIWRMFRYNRAVALFHAGAYSSAEAAATELALEYYDVLDIDPLLDVFGKNPAEILAALSATPTRDDDLKHLADCLELYALSRLKQRLPIGLAHIHAVKFYDMSGAIRSAVRTGQDVVDQFLDSLGDAEGARQFIEGHILPVVQPYRLTDLLVPVRAQYAVVLAYCGEIERARAEMNAPR